MASRWFYRVFDQEMGPVGFQDLVEMVRAGTLTEKDRVRRESGEEWIAPREVIGLFRAAQVEPATAKAPEPESRPRPTEGKSHPPEDIAPAPLPRRRRRRTVPHLGARGWVAAGLVLVVVAIVGYELWSHRKSRVFPKSVLGRPRPVDRESREAILGPRSKVPSIPGLKEGKPTPIPGLEAIDPGYSPCLTPDLRTIVFAAMYDRVADYDLYISTRDDVSKPFAPPKVIKSCQSKELEAFPTLSPDALELMFVRGFSQPRFYHSRRASVSDDFGEPAVWPVNEHGIAKPYLHRPQFIDRMHLTFCIVNLADDTRTIFTVERRDANSVFGPLQKVRMTDAWPPYFFCDNGLRAYCHSPDGVFFSNRRAKSHPYGPPLPILDPAVTGTMDGPFWLTPQEDAIFYVSTGPGKKPDLGPDDKGRKLWMVRF